MSKRILEKIATHEKCIEYLNKLLEFKGEKHLSDEKIHQGLCIQYLDYARLLQAEKNISSAWEFISKALEHIRQSYTSSREGGNECELECCVPEGYDECWNNPGYPYLIEADVWLEKARICMKKDNWTEAYGYIQHAEQYCKVTTREYYDEILDGIPEVYYEGVISDSPAQIIYKEIIHEKDKIRKHVDPKTFNKNMPSDDFLLQYNWSYVPQEDVKPIVEHWQNMIRRKDFHIFSEQQCYLILLEFYSFYRLQLNFNEKENLLTVIILYIDKAICASPINTIANENSLEDPWVIHTDDGKTINAYKKPKTVEKMEVCYWAWKADLLRFPNCGRERESMYARMHVGFLERIYFFDTKEYVFNYEYFTPDYLVKVYKEKVNKDTPLDLMEYATELLEINPMAKLLDFIEYIKMWN